MFHKVLHYVKSVRIRSYSDPYFPFFGLKNNSEQNKQKRLKLETEQCIRASSNWKKPLKKNKSVKVAKAISGAKKKIVARL